MVVTCFQCPFRSTLDVESIWRNAKQADETTSTHSHVKSFEEIPGPKGLPIVGTLFDYFKKDGLRFSKMFEVGISPVCVCADASATLKFCETFFIIFLTK